MLIFRIYIIGFTEKFNFFLCLKNMSENIFCTFQGFLPFKVPRRPVPGPGRTTGGRPAAKTEVNPFLKLWLCPEQRKLPSRIAVLS